MTQYVILVFSFLDVVGGAWKPSIAARGHVLSCIDVSVFVPIYFVGHHGFSAVNICSITRAIVLAPKANEDCESCRQKVEYNGLLPSCPVYYCQAGDGRDDGAKIRTTSI